MDLDWIHLKEISKNLSDQADPFLVALDCYSVFAEKKGILVVPSYNELVNIKLSTITDDPERPLKFEGLARIKGVNGLLIVRDNLNSFLLTKEKKIFTFKSFKRISEIEGFKNVKLFECFRNNCYVLVQQVGIEVKIQLYSSFGESNDLQSEFDISFQEDAVSLGGSRDTEKMCVQMIEGPLNDRDKHFFSEILACDLSQESIHDVLLISIDEKLMWVKYKNSFHEGVSDGYSIETITSTNENIRGLKYCDGFLMMLDQLSVLTILFICPRLKHLTKKEILLEGLVKCFRFHQNLFIYSNLRKVVFIDSTDTSAETYSVELKGIVCFTVVTELNCIIAICHNRMFYYIPLTSTDQQQKRRRKGDFQLLQNSDIELIPSIAKFIEVQEKNLVATEQRIKEAQNLKSLFQHLKANRDFTAGDAVVTFHQNVPKVPDCAIVCDIHNQQLGSGFIEIKISFSNILKGLTFSVAFYRQTMSGVLTQIVRVEDAKEIAYILIPAEEADDASNKMSLDVNFSYDFKNESRLLIYPININQVVPYDGPRIKLKQSLDTCLEIVNKMKM